MTLLSDLVDASERVGSTASRRSKIAEIAALLRRLQPEEIDIGVALLAGETLQRKTGIGYSLIDSARVAPAAVPSLDLSSVNRRAGSDRRHRRAWLDRRASTTAEEFAVPPPLNASRRSS